MSNLPAVKIGVLFSKSGPMEANGNHLINATRIAVDEINRNGGLLNHPLEMIVEDGESIPTVFARKAKKLIHEDGVAAIFGCWTSSSRKAVKSVVEKSKSLLWYPLQYEGLEESQNIFYTGSSLNQQVEPVMEWAETEKMRTCILLGSDYVYPRVANKLIRTCFTNFGGKILAERYYPLDAYDFTEVISMIKKFQPDLIFNTLNGSGNILFFRQLARCGIDCKTHPIMSFSFSEIELNMLDNEAEGSYACWSYFQCMSNPENKKFLKYLFQCSKDTSISSDPMVSAYSQVHLWKQAVIAANSFNTRKIQKAAIGQSFQSPGGLLTIQPNHHTRKLAAIARVAADNRFKIIWQSEQPLEAKPWLNIEDMKFPNKQLILEIMEGYPEAIHNNWRLESEISKRELVEIELKNSADQFKKANAVKNKFITNLSHEIRTPMNAILGLIHLLKDRSTDPEMLNTLEQLLNSANSLTAVINTIFDYSRLQSDTLEIIEEQFNIYDLVSILKQLFIEKAQKKKLDLEFLIDEGIHKTLIGDSVKLLQVLREILDNAIKFTKKGSVIFRLKETQVKSNSVILAISISDTGIGMSKDQIEHISRHVAQVDDSLNREFGGIGLNLKLITEMITLMGGELQIESKPGKGSTFSFQIEFERSAEILTATQETNLEDTHILVVEDNEINQLITKQILENHAIHVSIANNGLVAVEMAKTDRFDAVLMDIQMPVMDGYQAAGEIRKIEQLAKTPILALTANAMPEEVKKIKEVGMQAYISKPINADTLISTLRYWISWRRTSSALTEISTMSNTLLLNGINTRAGLNRLNGRMALYQSLLFTFSEQFANFNKELESVIINKDYTSAIEMVHTLKGVAGNIGAQEVFECSKNLNAALKTGKSKKTITAECKNLYQELLKVIVSINEYRDQLLVKKPVSAKVEGAFSISTAKSKKIKSQLIELHRLLTAGNADSIHIIEKLKEISGAFFEQTSLHEIEQYIKAYDFEFATEKVKKLLQDLEAKPVQLQGKRTFRE